MAHIFIRVNLIWISSRVHVVRFSYPDSLKKRHTTLTNITSRWLPQRIRTTDIHYPGIYIRIIDWSKQVLHVITTTCHGPRSATCRVKGQEWSDGKSLPAITSHDFWQSQQLPRSLSAAYRVMMALPPSSVIMTTQNIFLPLKRETKLLIKIFANEAPLGRQDPLLKGNASIVRLYYGFSD